MKQYKIVLENGTQLFNKTYSEAAAERVWQSYNGIYTDDDGNEHYIYIAEA